MALHMLCDIIPQRQMTRRTRLLLQSLTIFVTSCFSLSDKKCFEHNYAKYWDKYSTQKLVEFLYADTLNVGPDIDGGSSIKGFYIQHTEQLITDLQKDKGKMERLYPMTAFDELQIVKWPIGSAKTFTNEQTKRFLEMINDPVSFNWAETTFEAAFRLNFLKENKIVASLTIDDDKSIVKTVPNWPTFKKMKFGHLTSARSNDLKKLHREMGF